MKKSAFLTAVCAGLFLLFGCSDLSTEEKGKTDSAEAIDTIECENPATCLHILKPFMNSEARTALPEFSQTSLNSFAYSLSGAHSGKEQTVLGTYENLSSLLNDSLPCEEGVWNFTLTASRNGTILRGSLSEIEIRAGENQITFTLDWDKSALSGSGNLTFTLDYSEAGNATDVKLVTAELFSYNTTSHEETPLSGFAETPLTISNNSVTYQAEGLAAGNYRVKIYLYADEGKANLVNTWRELAIITGGQTSLASRKFTALNKVYEITYDLDGGQEVTANPLIRSYTRNTNTFTLPAPTRSGYAFGGWYKDADFTNQVTKIVRGSSGNKTFYAKWTVAYVTVSPASIDDLEISSTVDATTVIFTVQNSSAADGYIWELDGVAQDANGASFTLDTSPLGEGVYEIEVKNGDLSSMTTVSVGAPDSFFFVSTSGDDTNDGFTKETALKTIDAAVDKMSDPEIDYTIYIDGMLGRSSDNSSIISGQFIAEVMAVTTESSWTYTYTEPIKAKSITVRGLNPLNANGEPVDGIDPSYGPEVNGKSTPVLLIATSVPVILQNIKISGGYLKNGEALVIGTSYTNNEGTSVPITSNVTIKEGVLITGNNDTGSGSFYGSVVKVTNNSTLRMGDGKITDNVSGNGVLSVARGSTFEMTGGYIGGNHLYPYYEYESNDDPTRSMTCGVYVTAPAADASLTGGLFKISGDAVVDEVYLKTGAVVTVADELTGSSQIQIVPEAYTEGLQVIEIADDSFLTPTEARDYFTVKENEGAYWQVLEDGTLFEGYLTSISGLSALISSLSDNTADTPYKVSIDDRADDFEALLDGVNSELTSSEKYVWLSFKDSDFTKLEGTFSEYVTCLTIPAQVTSLGFIDGAGIQRFKVASGNENFAVSGTVLCSKDLNILYRWPPASPATVGTIPANIYSIADGAFANCRNIKEFNVLEGNSYFKVTTGDIANTSSAYSAYQSVFYFVYDADIPTAPEDFEEWNTWNQTYGARLRNQYRDGYVPIPVLTSYDGKTLVAVPPALELLTVADVKEKSGGYEKDQGGTDITYTASSGISLDFDTVRPYALCGIKNVQEITLGVTATSLPAYTFKDCSALKYVYLSIAGSTIKPYTFSDCTALQGVNFRSETITTVQSNAFDGCTGLKSLYFQAGENTGRSGTASDAYPASCTVTISGYVA